MWWRAMNGSDEQLSKNYTPVYMKIRDLIPVDARQSFDALIKELKNEIFDEIDVEQGIEDVIQTGRIDDLVNDVVDDRIQGDVDEAISNLDWYSIISNHDIYTTDDFDYENFVTNDDLSELSDKIDGTESTIDDLNDEVQDIYARLLKLEKLASLELKLGITEPKPPEVDRKEVIMLALEKAHTIMKEKYDKEFVIGFSPAHIVDNMWSVTVNFNSLIKIELLDIDELMGFFGAEATEIFIKNKLPDKYFEYKIYQYASKWVIDIYEKTRGEKKDDRTD